MGRVAADTAWDRINPSGRRLLSAGEWSLGGGAKIPKN
jgi:hypothetical protein